VSRCSIFIPAYNAARTLPAVFDRIPSELWPRIQALFVIDDGSVDDTAAVARRLAAQRPVEVVSFASNQGYGSAVREGLRRCTATGADYIACLHADGQYPPEKLPEFLDYMAERGVDVLQGSRHKDGTALRGGMPYYKYVAGKVLTWLENRTFGLTMTDYHSGFLVYSRRAAQAIPFDELSHYFDFDLEVIACARARGLVVDELAIPTRYADEKSHLNPIRYGLRCLRVMGRYKLGRYHA
jgi:glycosyltransferase involved in cell wall biosynthesis